MTRWRPGEAEIEQLLANHALQLVTGTVADGRPALERASHTLVSAQSLLDTDPINAFVLAYDAVRQACTALLTHQGLRPTSSGGHVAVERAVRAQFGAPFAPYGGLRRRRNEVEYPSHPDEHVDPKEASEAINIAESLIESAEKLLPHLQLFTT
jgi:acetylornithine deacetylase/succinyl-diaminopimelate desuccinylase-like protein